jgi:hypothetical protein
MKIVSLKKTKRKIEGKIYLSGPMTGYTDNNFPFFNKFAKNLEGSHEYFNPAVEVDGGWGNCLRYALKEMFDCDCVLLIGQWQKSKGVALEVYNAQQVDMPVYIITGEDKDRIYVRELQDSDFETEDILNEANNLVYGNRQASYGHPKDDYDKTSAFWNILLKEKLKEELTAEDAIMCMMAVKMSREMNRHKKDNLVDLAGYAQCLQRVVMRRREEDEN